MDNTNITLSDRAANHVKRYLTNHGNNTGLRLGVKPTGCSGYQYTVKPADNTLDTDRIFFSQGIKIVVDANSLPYLAGTELDYVREGLNEGFRFKNPNVQEICGCGESFTVREASH